MSVDNTDNTEEDQNHQTKSPHHSYKTLERALEVVFYVVTVVVLWPLRFRSARMRKNNQLGFSIAAIIKWGDDELCFQLNQACLYCMCKIVAEPLKWFCVFAFDLLMYLQHKLYVHVIAVKSKSWFKPTFQAILSAYRIKGSWLQQYLIVLVCPFLGDDGCGCVWNANGAVRFRTRPRWLLNIILWYRWRHRHVWVINCLIQRKSNLTMKRKNVCTCMVFVLRYRYNQKNNWHHCTNDRLVGYMVMSMECGRRREKCTFY